MRVLPALALAGLLCGCASSDVTLLNNAGMMGLGEPATVPTAGAVANAVANAIGARVTELPITPERVLAALRAKENVK